MDGPSAGKPQLRRFQRRGRKGRRRGSPSRTFACLGENLCVLCVEPNCRVARQEVGHKKEVQGSIFKVQGSRFKVPLRAFAAGSIGDPERGDPSYFRLSQRDSSPSAQGCEERATLGLGPNKNHNPEMGCIPATAGMDSTPAALGASERGSAIDSSVNGWNPFAAPSARHVSSPRPETLPRYELRIWRIEVIAKKCATCYAIRMQTTVNVDKTGRLVVPKELRQAMGLRGAAELELDVIDGKLVGQPAARRAPIVRTRSGLRAFKIDAGVSAREAIKQMRQDRYG